MVFFLLLQSTAMGRLALKQCPTVYSLTAAAVLLVRFMIRGLNLLPRQVMVLPDIP